MSQCEPKNTETCETRDLTRNIRNLFDFDILIEFVLLHSLCVSTYAIAIHLLHYLCNYFCDVKYLTASHQLEGSYGRLEVERQGMLSGDGDSVNGYTRSVKSRRRVHLLLLPLYESNWRRRPTAACGRCGATRRNRQRAEQPVLPRYTSGSLVLSVRKGNLMHSAEPMWYRRNVVGRLDSPNMTEMVKGPSPLSIKGLGSCCIGPVDEHLSHFREERGNWSSGIRRRPNEKGGRGTASYSIAETFQVTSDFLAYTRLHNVALIIDGLRPHRSGSSQALRKLMVWTRAIPSKDL
ncbi:hypothetical protein F5J12DRAFT_785275 [Pisolithus orientalis]|uniref:uncharacterized protein n=1 Tax=Pisolithus orientalis TaxID=936130 RepID=UPI00222454D0|nr:uncharacterized protein F5J12DRAFT_785275 [Pisolithus orientalis]KAI5996856.1 hypothetical protein F5J12DRAFT_785275 [Pisolithus orientalis]